MITWGGQTISNGQPLNDGGFYTSGAVASPANTLRGTKSSSINLTWSWITGAGSYNVKRCDASAASCIPATIVSTPTIPQYAEAGNQTSYFYSVEAVNQCGATP